MQEDPAEYTSRGVIDARYWIQHSAGQQDNLRSYASSNSCLSLAGEAAEHNQPVLLEGLSKRPTSVYQSADAASQLSQQNSEAAELQQHLAAASAGERAARVQAAGGVLGGGAAAGAAMTAAFGGLKKILGRYTTGIGCVTYTCACSVLRN
jgi:ferric-dicitrate binding protein FerR (iron transport regulator)